MTTVMRFDEVSFSYRKGNDSRQILSNHNFEILEGEFVSLIGPSGCGKSTVLKLMAGMMEPDSGRIDYLGEENGRRLGKVGFMPQQEMLMPWRSVTGNAALPLELSGVKKKEAAERVRDLLPSFGLEATARLFPFQLSGGMRQRVSFLRSVLTGNPLLLLDEPFSALDAITRRSMQEWLTVSWEQWNRTIFLITHDIEEAIFLSDRVFVMKPGLTGSFHEVEVPFPRPRTAGLLLTPPFIALREELTGLLQAGQEQVL